MYINPANGVMFSKEELMGLFANTVNDIIKRDDDVACYLRCYAEQINSGAEISIKRIKALNNRSYIMLDLNVLCSNLIKQTIEDKGSKGPIILDPVNDKLDIVYNTLINSILSTQDICLKGRNRMTLTFDMINEKEPSDNIIRGKIRNIKNIDDEVWDKIKETNSRYMEIEFTLEAPRKSYILYIYITRDKHLGITIYNINVSGSGQYSIVSIREDFKKAFNDWVRKIYKDFQSSCLDPSIMVKYYCIPELKELI